MMMHEIHCLEPLVWTDELWHEGDDQKLPLVSRTKHSRGPSRCDVVPRPLQSDIFKSRQRAINWMESTGRIYSFFSYIPSRIGHSPCIDLAVKANWQAQAVAQGDRAFSNQRCFHTSALAASALQSLLQQPDRASSDEALLSVALLHNFENSVRSWSTERTQGPVDRACATHMKGLSAMFLARGPPDASATMIYRAMFYSMNWYIAFGLQVASDKPSPFLSFIDAEPPLEPQSTPYWHTLALWKVSNQLYVHLPRVARLSKMANTGNELDINTLRPFVSSLYALKNEHAENLLLHNVNVIKSVLGAKIVPYVFRFQTFDDFAAALDYWTTRLWVICSCYRIQIHSSDIDPDALKVEATRTAKNIMMCCEEFLTYIEMTRMKGGTAYGAIWEILDYVDVCSGIPTPRVRSWLLKRSNELSGGRVKFTATVYKGLIKHFSGSSPLPGMAALGK